MKPLLGCGITCLLVAVLAIAAAVFYFSRTPGNTASAVERETDLENGLHLENDAQQPWDVRIDTEVVHLDFSLDGKRLAAACGDHVAVIDVESKTILKRIDAPDYSEAQKGRMHPKKIPCDLLVLTHFLKTCILFHTLECVVIQGIGFHGRCHGRFEKLLLPE